MRTWALLLGGLLAWATQFFALYIVASVFGSGMLARAITIVVTIAALAADGVVATRALRRREAAGADRYGRWLASLALLGAGLSAVAIVWQGLPAILA